MTPADGKRSVRAIGGSSRRIDAKAKQLMAAGLLWAAAVFGPGAHHKCEVVGAAAIARGGYAATLGAAQR